MTLTFKGSPKPTLGVEIELQVIDPQSLDLTPRSSEILESFQEIGDSRIKAEVHRSMIEIDTEISTDIKQCRAFLNDRLLKLNEISARLGLHVAVTGTHPFQQWSERQIFENDRYVHFHEKFRWFAKRVNVYGLHVHVGVPSGDRALAICNAMTQYLPYLLALSANSPYWHGVDTGMQSSRINILDAFPFGGVSEFSNWSEFEHYHNTLHKVGAIKSFKDLYWYVRPNLIYGTIEIRMCDAMSTLDETMALVALIQCLVANINEEIDTQTQKEWTREHFWIAPENLWIAARDGLEGKIIVDLQGRREKIADGIVELIDRLIPLSIQLNCEEELQYIHTIIKNGNGAERQRRTFTKTGSLKEVVSVAHAELISSLQVDANL